MSFSLSDIINIVSHLVATLAPIVKGQQGLPPGPPYDFSLSCQLPSRWIRMAHIQDVSPDMETPITWMKDGALESFDLWMHDTFFLGASTSLLRFTNKPSITGNPDDICSELYWGFDTTSVLSHYIGMPSNVGTGHPTRSHLDALWMAANIDWDIPMAAGRRVIMLQSSALPQLSPSGLPPFNSTADCSDVDFPSIAGVISALNNKNIYVAFVVSPEHIQWYQNAFSGLEPRLTVLPIGTTADEHEDNIFAAMDSVYCGAAEPTNAPTTTTVAPTTTTAESTTSDEATTTESTTSDVATTTSESTESTTSDVATTTSEDHTTTQKNCTEDAILQLLHLQDISWSYTNDLQNLKAKFPILLDELEEMFHRREVALGTFSDKPIEPVGYWLDYCYREDVQFTESAVDFMAALNGATIKSGADWKESQYDAVMDGLTSPTLNWETRDEVEGRKVLRVVLLATDAGPHVKGDLPQSPSVALWGCEYRDYPSPAELGSVIDSMGVHPIFLVTSDVYNYWKRKLSAVSTKGRVIRLADSQDVISAIEDALTDICDSP